MERFFAWDRFVALVSGVVATAFASDAGSAIDLTPRYLKRRVFGAGGAIVTFVTRRLAWLSAITVLSVFVVGCAKESEPSVREAPQNILSVGSEEVELLLSDAPMGQIESLFKMTTPRSMSNGLVQLATMRDRPEVVALLDAAWRLDRISHPEFNWEVVDTPTVRLTVAAVLGQWAVDKTEYRTFVQRYLNSSDTLTRMDAVIALGTIGDEADIKKLEEYAVGGDDLLALSALGTLQSLQTEEASEVIEAVANNPSLPATRRAEAAKMLAKPK